MNHIKIKKLYTGCVIDGVVTGTGVIEKYVKAGEEVTVREFVLARLQKLGEAYERLDDIKSVSTKGEMTTDAGKTT